MPAPFSKGAFLRPVSFYGAIPGFFRLSIDSVGTRHYKIPQTKTGVGAEIHHPEPKRRVNLPMVPPGGVSRGGQFERERVVPPLSRLLCLLSCRSKKVRPRWQAPGVPPVSISPAGVPPVSISHGSLLRFVTSLTRPVSAACRRTYYLFLLPYSLNSPGIVTAVEVGAPITFIKYQPPSKPLAYRPLAPSVTCGDSSLPEGAIGFCLFT